MRSTTYIDASTTLVTHECWCGVLHAIPSGLDRAATQRGQTVYCPLGHTWVVTKSQVKIEQEAREQAERRACNLEEDLNVEKAAHSITKGKLTKAKNRASAGVCQECNRTFQNVARHVATKHAKAAPKA